MTYDILIVGAGVVGAALARGLSRTTASVAVLDSANDVGTGTSKANTAILHTGFDAAPGTLEARLVRRGYRLLGDYARAAGIAVERTGAILVAWNETEVEALPALKAKAEANGYDACRIVPAEEVYAALPHLGPGALAGLTVPDESIIDPWTPSLAFATEATANGAHLLLGREVTGVSVGASTTTVHTSAGDVTTTWLVNAAGLGADTLDRLLGHDRFTVTPRRGELLVFDKLAAPLVTRIVLPVPTALGKGVLVSPTAFGNVMLGPTAENLEDRTATNTSEGGFEFLRSKGERLMPRLFDEEVTASYAGLRASIDHPDYLIEVDAAQRYLLVGGIRSTGLTSALAIAEYAEEQLAAAGLNLPARPDPAPVPVMPNLGERFPRASQQPDRIAADPSYGEIVCFCERVSAGEIRDSLCCAVPAVDRAGVSRRTRATNGRCQGFFCGAAVDALITEHGRDPGPPCRIRQPEQNQQPEEQE
ncbi:FAD-dependent oxidoreductase [Pseudactinotalea sp. HY160]|uniref:NAD(P)/FAD-dependent oxidoreductase n=1 Tax=Pseudactinotalea sp. HY160 TaxID=2654490 RepID=UPI00128BB231|nr:NAD(P)/FAD-dependent oxidoreductase [Pseudactinotalea sp. HY160]MPV49701.1 FAD-dependent oxidoreductase [Pseudactinotalea sp. HY160]